MLLTRLKILHQTLLPKYMPARQLDRDICSTQSDPYSLSRSSEDRQSLVLIGTIIMFQAAGAFRVSGSNRLNIHPLDDDRGNLENFV